MRTLRLELPAALSASDAKTLAQAALTRADLARERRIVTLDWRAIAIAPGERIRIAGEDGVWRVAGWSLEGMALQLELARVARAPIAATATSGRVSAAPDLTIGTTIVHAFEIPPLDDAVATVPQLTIAVGGTGAGWRGAGLQMSLDGGARWSPIGERRLPAVTGTLVTGVPAASAMLVDRASAIDVALAHDGLTLADADAAAIDAGANRALIGDEIVQFERAEPIGDARWRLSGLWRGRRGTEWAAGGAGAGARFVLLDPATIQTVALPPAAIGTTASVMAAGVGDGDAPAQAAAPVTGASVAPPSPARARATALGGDTYSVSWVRRSRAGWRWNDGGDVPLAEEQERYALGPDGASLVAIKTTVTEPRAEIAAVAGQSLAIRQLGTQAASRPALVILP